MLSWKFWMFWHLSSFFQQNLCFGIFFKFIYLKLLTRYLIFWPNDKQCNICFGFQTGLCFFPQKRRKKFIALFFQMQYYVIVLWNLRWVESSLTGLNCFRKVNCKNAIRTPLHFLNSASKKLKFQRWISRANNKLLIEALTLLEEAAPIKWFGRVFFPVCT